VVVGRVPDAVVAAADFRRRFGAGHREGRRLSGANDRFAAVRRPQPVRQQPPAPALPASSVRRRHERSTRNRRPGRPTVGVLGGKMERVRTQY